MVFSSFEFENSTNIYVHNIKKNTTLKDKVMEVGISILGSGSSGNSLVIHSEEGGIMFDAGFSRAEILSRLGKIGLNPRMLTALILSHEHGDHCKGARVFADSVGIQTFATASTVKILRQKELISENFVVFEPGSEFQVAGFTIRPFTVPHDAIETVGFVVSKGKLRIGLATDLGYMSTLCEQRLKGCSAIILESNHDVRMQMNSKRGQQLIRRILGKNGHLSNESAVEAFEKIVTKDTSNIFLVHLSKECNQYEIVEKTALEKLANMRRQDILVKIATQEPLQTIYLKQE